MRGAPARAIQELAGHQDLGTTQRYMHLSPAALDAAIRLLETDRHEPRGRGEIVEAAGKIEVKDSVSAKVGLPTVARNSLTCPPSPKATVGNLRLHSRAKVGAGGGNRTRTPLSRLRILSPVRLPVPPPRRVV